MGGNEQKLHKLNKTGFLQLRSYFQLPAELLGTFNLDDRNR
jgi:hypothetical protein